MDADPRPALRLTLQGVPALQTGSVALPLSLTRGYALLAYLALEGRGVPREHLVSLLWPEADPPTGRARLRRLLYRVEQVCACALFDAQAGSVALRTGALSCDAVTFRRHARTAIAAGPDAVLVDEVQALARAACAPLMDGLDVGSDAFDDWLRTQRVEHEQVLTRLLMQMAQAQRARGHVDDAAQTAERLLRIQPWSEPAHVLRMALAADAFDAAGVDAAFMRCAELLRDEFGVKPAAATEQAFIAHRRRAERQADGALPGAAAEADVLAVRFANGPHGPVAHARIGNGREALVVMPGFVSHIEIGWEHPGVRRALQRLARRFTVIVFDRRGVGLSERIGQDSTVASTAGDVLSILDDAGIDRAWLFGSSEGGPAAIRLAALHPGRVAGLILFGAMARGSQAADYPWALPRAAYDAWMRALVAQWGGPADIATFAPTLADDAWTRAWWARLLRHAASPASLRAVLTGLRDADVRGLLAEVDRPTLVMHRRGDRAVRFAAGEYLATHIAGARWLPLDGDCHWWWVEDADAVIEAILDFTAAAAVPAPTAHGRTACPAG